MAALAAGQVLVVLLTRDAPPPPHLCAPWIVPGRQNRLAVATQRSIAINQLRWPELVGAFAADELLGGPRGRPGGILICSARSYATHTPVGSGSTTTARTRATSGRTVGRTTIQQSIIFNRIPIGVPRIAKSFDCACVGELEAHDCLARSPKLVVSVRWPVPH